MYIFFCFKLKYKEKRSDRLLEITANGRFVIEMVAEYLGLEVEVVLNEVIDYQTSVDYLNSLFVPGGRCAILFYYQDGSPPEIGNY